MRARTRRRLIGSAKMAGGAAIAGLSLYGGYGAYRSLGKAVPILFKYRRAQQAFSAMHRIGSVHSLFTTVPSVISGGGLMVSGYRQLRGQRPLLGRRPQTGHAFRGNQYVKIQSRGAAVRARLVRPVLRLRRSAMRRMR